ncbi:sensor histidine kinase [Micromonospora endolithica]|uniref:histidine kinase n=1 Tax=Micromonospora endolithica TaxID=230091 RepID=A0A3A9Z651_9ACTN|nr:sensor histidine kinase [Micromonospora endolithica]RKN43499.1 HAMP domain-containing protein [Micromonospora endolithica]TWJ24085.1 signal transduction histidine kinase [Micromonospora endolithica]
MSKRPKTAGSFLSRLRRPAGRLRDMPIWSKLGLIMIVPTIATVVVGTSGLVEQLQSLNNANRAGDLVNLVGYSGDLVHTLQDERTSSVRLLGARGAKAKDLDRYEKAFQTANARVDAARGPYSQQRGEVEDLPANFSNLLRDIDRSLSDLPGTRSQVFNGGLGTLQALQLYEGLIENLIAVRDSATQLAGDNELSDQMRAATALARDKDALARGRDVVHQAFIQKELTPTLRDTYIGTLTAHQQALQNFGVVAGPENQEFYRQVVAGPDTREYTNYEGVLRGLSNATSLAAANFTPDQWDAAVVAQANLIRKVESKIDTDVIALADDLRSDVQREVFLETGLLLSMLLLAILFAYLVARSMARSLRDLRQGALSIAQYGLPQAVARLRDPQVTGQLTPVQLANQIAEPLPVRSKDEFGQVTEAFNAVHLEAVRTAAEQAALRSSVATMFVNLARRSQILVDRLIGHLDRLERGEEDPDRLAELFQLDHLATRMRRNDENLLVLAGADSTRVQREPAALIDVLRAAQSEVEHYTRIEFGIIDRDIEVAAHAVNDLVHLIAELFDNATAFSPPDSQVMVEARRVGDRASLYVEDRGIGISPEQIHDLNERLATPPQVDVAVSRMMGLVVVARLASRHGVKVELRPGTDRGTVAEVVLPTSVLVPRALAGRGNPTPALPAPQSSGPAPVFGALPALGNGPAVPSQRSGESGNQVTLGGRPFEPAPRNGSGAGNGPARSMPAWSDLTGASALNGSHGGDGFTPRPAGGDGFNPRQSNGGDQFAPRTTNGQSIDPLPQRRSGDEPGATGQQPTIPRQLPSSPEARPYSAPPVSAPPSHYAGPPVSSPPVSGMPVSASPVSGTPVSGAPVSGQPYSAPPATAPLPQRPVTPSPSPSPAASAPPAWPPVAGPPRDTAAPAVPERLAAALDMTTELPRVTRPGTETSNTPSAAPGPAARPAPATPPAPARPTTPQQAQSRQRYADETMELPIFRELESAWFRTRRSGPEESATTADTPAATNGAPTQQFAKVDTAGRAVPQTPPGTTGNAPMADTPTAGAPRENGTPASRATRPGVADAFPQRRPAQGTAGWQTAADDGWRAASAASEVPVAATTSTGLPKRTPMAQLVPGAVEKPTTSVQRRTPEAVRGLLSAYHRGVQRGRSHPSDGNPTSPEETPGGQQSSQSGSGPVAGSGQKEQER